MFASAAPFTEQMFAPGRLRILGGSPAPWTAPLRGQLLVAQNRGLAIWGQYLAMARQNLPKKYAGEKYAGDFLLK